MIPINRNQIVLVWKNTIDNHYYCNFCHIRESINETYYRFNIGGNCPIALRVCRCSSSNVDNRNIKPFDNKEDNILATIYKCYMKGKDCYRNCSLCSINSIITKLYTETQHESQ